MITAATIRHIQCAHCKKYLTGSFLFIYTHEENCKTRTGGKTIVPVRDSTSQNVQANKIQGKQRIIKSSRI